MKQPPENCPTLSQHERDALAKMWDKLFSKLAHDIRSSLCTISLFSSTVKKRLPELTHAYQLASEHALIKPELTEKQLEQCEDAMKNISTVIEKLSDLIEWLHPICHDMLADSSQAKTIDVSDFIDAFLQQPVFSEEHREFIKINQKNAFSFKFTDFFLQHVLTLLAEMTVTHWGLKNISGMEISTDTETHHHVVTFKTDLTQTADDMLPNCIEHLFFSTKEAMIVQLSFCQLALMQLGGQIAHEFLPGKHLTVALRFTKAEN